MTPRERVEAALQHREPDRTPVFEYVFLSPLADTLLGRPYAADRANWSSVLNASGFQKAVRQNAVDRLDLAALLGHDMLFVYPPPLSADTRLDPVGAPPDGPPEADPVERLIRRNNAASVQPPPSADTFLIYSVIKEEMARRDIDLPILAPAYVHGVWTDTDLMESMLLAPEVAKQHFALATERALHLIEHYVDLGIEQIGVGGDFSGTRPLISPSAYKAFIVPEVRRLSRRLHEDGRYAVNASDGNLWSVIDDFLFGCEVDGYLEIDMHAEMDMATLKQRYGDAVTLYGNLDCGNILSFGSEDEVRKHTMDCLQAGLGDGGHILCASNAIMASVSLQNYLAVVNAHRDFFGLPRLRL